MAGPIWTIDVADGTGTVLSHRSKTYCVAEDVASLSLAEPELSGIPLSSLPAILLGFPPLPVVLSGVDEVVEIHESPSRTWRGRVEQGQLASWSLTDEYGPLMGGSRQERGGILSHREGYQFRWQEQAREQFIGDLGEFELPPDYREVPCDEKNSS